MLAATECEKRRCRWYAGTYQSDGTESTERPSCAAFPVGIPYEIAYGTDKHEKPIEGDNGFQYEEETT